MVSEVAPYVATEFPHAPHRFDLSDLDCVEARCVFNQVTSIRDMKESQLIEELNRDVSPDTSKNEWRQLALFRLVKLAFTASRVGQMIIETTEKYNYPEGRKHQNLLDDYFYTFEHALPLCDFSTTAPTNRERHVVCHQILNYFSLINASIILKQCSWSFIDLNNNPQLLATLGSFVFYAEDPLRQLGSMTTDSWSLRRDWEDKLKSSYCQKASSAERVWHAYFCNDKVPSLPTEKEQNFGYWKTVIFPLIKKNGGVYSSIVRSEVEAELSKHFQAKKFFEQKASAMASFFEERFVKLEASLRTSNEREKAIRQVMKYKEMLHHLVEQYLKQRSTENWQALQDHLDVFEIFINSLQVSQDYPHIEALILRARQVPQPSSNTEKDELKDEL